MRMTARLHACPVCARHVRADEKRCPFCRVVLPECFGAAASLAPPLSGLTRGQRYRFNARSIAAGFVGSVAVTSSLTPSCTPEKADNVDCGTYLQDIDGECFGAPAYGEAGCEDCCGGDAEAPPDVGASDVRVDAADADIVDAASGDALVDRADVAADGDSHEAGGE
jgi:hypothetical protein